MGGAAAHAHCGCVQVRACGDSGDGPFCTMVPACISPTSITTPPHCDLLQVLPPLVSASLSKLCPSANSPGPQSGLAHGLVQGHVSPGSQVASSSPTPSCVTPTLPSSYILCISPNLTPTILTARKVTELLKTFCESKRLTTDKVQPACLRRGWLGVSLSLNPKPGAGTSSSLRP